MTKSFSKNYSQYQQYFTSNYLIVAVIILIASCGKKEEQINQPSPEQAIIKPVVVTDTVAHDTDDPAIWINKEDPSKSLIIGTDKNEDGSLYVFDLDGKIIPEKSIKGLKRPNNVDVEYGLSMQGKSVDIAVVTERFTHKLRIYSLPEMKPIDGGGIGVFEGDTTEGYRDLMGIALYKDPVTSRVFAIVGRKNGPLEDGYLHQYELRANQEGIVEASLVRKFGKYSGRKEIESIAVDDELGYIYYSDEGVGVRKYYADPAKGNQELALFGKEGFKEDHEGISIYKVNDRTGYILVSDQGANKFRIFSREGTDKNPHEHLLIKVIDASTLESDGSDIVSISLNDKFQYGLFVAMSTDKTFHYYRWEDIAGKELKVARNGKPVDKQMLSSSQK